MEIQKSDFYRFAKLLEIKIQRHNEEITLSKFSELLDLEEFSKKEEFEMKALTLFGYNNFILWWLCRNYLKNQGEEKWLAFRDKKLIEPINSEKNLINFLLDFENENDGKIAKRFLVEFDNYLEAYQKIRIYEIRKIGYWSKKSEYKDYPSASDFINETEYEGQQKIIEYLEKGTPMSWITPGYSTCRICGIDNGTKDLSDGKYMWPEGLAHYVKDHNIRLPKEFEEHVLSNWKPIDTLNLSFGEYFVTSEWWKKKK